MQRQGMVQCTHDGETLAAVLTTKLCTVVSVFPSLLLLRKRDREVYAMPPPSNCEKRVNLDAISSFFSAHLSSSEISWMSHCVISNLILYGSDSQNS